MTTSRKFIPFALVCAATLAAALPGCTTSPSSDGQAARETNRVTGSVTTLLSAPLDQAYIASQAAIDSLQFTTTKESKDALKGVLTAKTADNKNVHITLTRKSDSITELNVNAGPLNQALAETVADRVQQRVR